MIPLMGKSKSGLSGKRAQKPLGSRDWGGTQGISLGRWKYSVSYVFSLLVIEVCVQVLLYHMLKIGGCRKYILVYK